MTPAGFVPTVRPGFAVKEKDGLRDYWAVYAAHAEAVNQSLASQLRLNDDLAIILRTPSDALTAQLQRTRLVLQREAILQDEWAAYAEAQHQMGAAYAQAGLSFQEWVARSSAFRKGVLPFLFQDYAAEPERLMAAIIAMDQLIDWALQMIGQGYLGVREQMTHGQQEALYDASQARQAEVRFRGLLESAPDAIVIVDRAGRIQLVNSQMERMFGYNRDEILGQPLESLIPERLRTEHPAHREGFFAEPHSRPMGIGLALFGRHKSGAEFPLEISLSPIETEEGPQVIAAVRDITERRQAEEALRRSEERTALMLDNILDYAIIRLDPQGRIMSWNAGAERLKGYRAAEIIGQNFAVLYPAEDLAAHRPEQLLQLAATQGRVEDESWRVRRDGSRFWANVIITALRDSAGELTGFGKVTRDLSTRQQFEQTLREKNAELENAMLAKDRFLASMSHELRTPLNAVIGFTGTLLMRLPGPLTPDQEKQLQTVRSSARHLLSLINDLLDTAKIDAGKVELHLEPVDCQALLDEVAATLRPTAEGKGLDFVVQKTESAIRLVTDRRALSQILVNLTNNAIKFTETGQVRLALAQEAARTEFIISDTGLGIAPEAQARLFQAFQQVGGTATRRQEGTGLGLYLSQKLAGLLGGHIELDSKPGQGSTFRLVIEGQKHPSN